MKVEGWKLAQRQRLPLKVKINKSLQVIRHWYEAHDGKVYVAFSGGKDSTVMLHLVRSLYPEVKAIFCDTGLEYPELKAFVKQTPNTEVIRPEMSFVQVVDKYGYAVVNKNVSMAISRYRNTTDPIQKEYRMYGTKNGQFIGKAGVIPEKWRFLVNAPFKISGQCCDAMKKIPFHKYENETGLKPFIGLMASESDSRKVYYMKNGCNSFDSKYPKSLPIGFWEEENIWEYIRKFKVPYCSIYDTGVDRTGCMFCMLGLQKDNPERTRFDIMKETHPVIHKYCMEKMGMEKIINYVNKK